jgi:type IV secretory pathway TraG/TraD family ATPase VirD4
LSFVEGHYNLNSLYNYLFVESFRDELQEKASLSLDSLEEKEKRLLKSYMSYYENVFSNFDPKVKSSVIATAAQVLTPFNQPELIDAFCQDNSDTMDMTALFDKWVFLVDMPLSRFGLGAKLVYTLIKLRFFNIMQDRINNPEWNQSNPVFFMCDEYQELISANKHGLSDLNFWDKSRSSKTIGIISSQSISSFYAAIGNHDLANAVIQNFRQKFCFRTEDRATLTLMNDLAGQARVQKMTVSQGSTTGHDGKQSTNHNESLTEAREAVLDAPLFRQLEENQVIGLLSVNGRSMDDLFWVVPVYV